MFQTEAQGAVHVVTCGGPLNHENVTDFRENIDKCLGGQPMIVLDLGESALIDSSGLESLLEVQEEVETLGGSVKLAAAGSLCQDALRATGISDRFEQFDTVKAAIGSYSR